VEFGTVIRHEGCSIKRYKDHYSICHLESRQTLKGYGLPDSKYIAHLMNLEYVIENTMNRMDDSE